MRTIFRGTGLVALSMLFLAGGTLCGCTGGGEQKQPVVPSEPTPPPEIEYTIDETAPESGKTANHTDFFAEKVVRKENSPLAGKTIYWLGSSVTYGAASGGEAMAEFLAAKTGAVCVKEAVSGTTIFDDGKTADTGEKSYTRRLTNSTSFDKSAHVDAFICQISTNDATDARLGKRGELTGAEVTEKELFDRATTLGGVEYIIAYVTETWHCPVYFYSGSYFGDPGTGVRTNRNPSGSNYAALVEDVKGAVAKWQALGFDVDVIDLFNDVDFNESVSDSYYKWCTSDAIHPMRAGYLNWWMPYFEQYLTVRLCLGGAQ